MSVVFRLITLASLTLLSAGCGKRGPLIYPDMLLPAAAAAVSAQQSGSAVRLQFAITDKDRAGRPLHGVAGVKISRRVTEATQTDVCRLCTSDYRPFRTLYLDHLPTDTQRFGNQLILLDADVTPGNLYSYSILQFTPDGLAGAPSEAADASVAAPLSSPSVKATSLPTEVRLQLSYSHSQTGKLLGYNLYRRTESGESSYLPINSEPVGGGEYVDTTLDRGVKYLYSARVLVRSEAGVVMESAASQEVAGMLKEDE